MPNRPHPHPESVYEERFNSAVENARLRGWPPNSSTKVQPDGTIRIYFGPDKWTDLPPTPRRLKPQDPGGRFGWHL